MEHDPFNEWYCSEADKAGDANFKPDDWTFLTLSYDAGSTEDVQEKEIARTDISSWVDRQSHEKSPGIDLLLARHKYVDISRSFNYQWLPFQPDEFRYILKKLHLPTQFLYLRSTGGAHCGAFTSHIEKDARGSVSRISIILRPGHGYATKHASMSAYVLSWDARTARTKAFLDGLSSGALDQFKGLLRSCSRYLGHPLMLPEMLLHMIITFLNDRLRIPSEEAFYEEEERTGLSKLHAAAHRDKAIWTWGFQDFQDATTRANRCSMTAAYLRRRFSFATHVARRLLEIQDELAKSRFEVSSIQGIIEEAGQQRRERLVNRIGLLVGYEHQNESVQKRIDNLINVLYTVLSQIDIKNQGKMAKINLQIAQAVRRDSIPMRTIAYVTLVFLPGAFVAAIFGMNFFQFDENTREIIVARSFWQYWALAVPLTLSVLVVWNLWVFMEHRNEVDAQKELPFLGQEPDLGGLGLNIRDY